MARKWWWPVLLVVMGILGAACMPLPGGSPFPALPGPSSAPTPRYPVGTIADGMKAELLDPGSMPPGMNLWSCKPSADHPYPVILVHGTFANEAFSWQALSPMLADAGYCVYGLDYGADASTLGRFYGLAPIPEAAQQLASFVQKVLASTGASEVDMVGHSQGGMMPRYYMKFLGGAGKVHMLVGLAPSNQGTTADGLMALMSGLQALGFPAFNELGCYSCTEQEQGSAFLTKLNAGGDTLPGPKYVVIESKYDEVVTPYTNAFLSGPADQVQNITLQNQCATDYTEHIGIIYDPVALQDVMNALGADSPTFRPRCSVVLPVISG
jgi:triacylglycerol esterase/lipase EstA (alpha/beta hydrolase family)